MTIYPAFIVLTIPIFRVSVSFNVTIQFHILCAAFWPVIIICDAFWVMYYNGVLLLGLVPASFLQHGTRDERLVWKKKDFVRQ